MTGALFTTAAVLLAVSQGLQGFPSGGGIARADHNAADLWMIEEMRDTHSTTHQVPSLRRRRCSAWATARRVLPPA